MSELHPFAGTRIVEAGGGLPLRLCGRLLADAGADVVRFPLGADPVLEQPYGDDWTAFLDEGKPLARGDAEALLARSHVLLTGHGHDAALGCQRALERHSHLLAACVTPFGQDGPYASLAADDVVVAALSGLADATPGIPDHRGRFDEPPVQSLAPLAEAAGGLIGATAVAGALLTRLRGGWAPRHVEVSVQDAASAMMAFDWGIAAYGGGVRGRRPIPADLAPNLYAETRNGTAVLVAFTEPHWRALVQLMGEPEWAADPAYANAVARAQHWGTLEPRLRAWAAAQEGESLLERAQALGSPICCSLTLRETVGHAHAHAVGSIRYVDGRAVPADLVVLDGARRERRAAAAPHTAGDGGDGGARPLEPLAGIRVLDLGQVVAGPYAGMLLAALGADVLLVEPPGFPLSRRFGPFVGEPAHDGSMMFNNVNRGKRSVQLDVTTEEGRSALHALVRESDVVLENYSRRAAEQLGLGYRELSALREDLVLASISGFGRSGPWGDYVALHSGVLLLSGAADVTRDEEGRMRLPGAIYPDLLTGAATALAIEQALARRALTGRGCHVQVSMLDTLLTCMGGLVAAAGRGESFGPHPSAAFLPVAEPERFLAVSGPVEPELREEAARLTRAEAMERLHGTGRRAGAVLDVEEVMRDANLVARGSVVVDEHPVAGPRPAAATPWRYDGERFALSSAPRLGSANDVLARLAAGADA